MERNNDKFINSKFADPYVLALEVMSRSEKLSRNRGGVGPPGNQHNETPPDLDTDRLAVERSTSLRPSGSDGKKTEAPAVLMSTAASERRRVDVACKDQPLMLDYNCSVAL